MHTTRQRNAFVSIACALLLVVPISPVRATAATRNVEITFTKWFINNTGGMTGFVGGDVSGSFGGQVLGFNPLAKGNIFQLSALYDVSAGPQSFAATIQGQQNNQTGKAVLNGVVTDGWSAGSQVHVEYDVINCPQSPFGCFQGTIRIMSAE